MWVTGLTIFLVSKGILGGEPTSDYLFLALMLTILGINLLSLRSSDEKKVILEKRRKKYQVKVQRLGKKGIRKAYRMSIKISLTCFAIALIIMFAGYMFMVWPLSIIAVGALLYAGNLEEPPTSIA
ncbi:hypothetical protein [Cerasicoccus fimbriatus]|uniref:hypothetical protein n=1 Tax=Cerasicoccus fimbriatus TaxID=3014554 RepID=UPI0022B48783|nr:hypothetical protein [Cerasicoccus sp. TK19100]